MKSILNLIVDILAVFRLTELLVKDEGPFQIFERFRRFLGRNAYRSELHKTVADAFNCVFCLGLWVAVLVLFLPRKIRYVLAIAGGQSIIESRR